MFSKRLWMELRRWFQIHNLIMWLYDLPRRHRKSEVKTLPKCTSAVTRGSYTCMQCSRHLGCCDNPCSHAKPYRNRVHTNVKTLYLNLRLQPYRAHHKNMPNCTPSLFTQKRKYIWTSIRTDKLSKFFMSRSLHARLPPTDGCGVTWRLWSCRQL